MSGIQMRGDSLHLWHLELLGWEHLKNLDKGPILFALYVVRKAD